MTEDVKADVPKKLSIQRRTKTTVSGTTTSGKSKAVQVEVRKKTHSKNRYCSTRRSKIKSTARSGSEKKLLNKKRQKKKLV